jgi:hypothetical protein
MKVIKRREEKRREEKRLDKIVIKDNIMVILNDK